MRILSEIHEKGWGHEEWIVNSVLYCGKFLRVEAGKKCSLHYHERKTETMHVTKGSVVFRFGDSKEELQELTLSRGESFHIEPFLLHQFEAIEDAEIVEFSTQHFEDDSIRVVKGD